MVFTGLEFNLGDGVPLNWFLQRVEGDHQSIIDILDVVKNKLNDLLSPH